MAQENPRLEKSQRSTVLISIMQRVTHGLPKEASKEELEIALQKSEEENAKFSAQLPAVDPDNPIVKNIMDDLDKEKEAKEEGKPSPALLDVLGLDESSGNAEFLQALEESNRKSIRSLLDLGEDSSDDEVEEKLRYYWEIYK